MATKRERILEHLMDALESVVEAGFEVIDKTNKDDTLDETSLAYIGGHLGAASAALTRTAEAAKRVGIKE